MNFRRLFTSEIGKNAISIILGLGLATIFRKVCNDKNCINFNGPIITDIEEKIFKYGEQCYTYSLNADKCDDKKRIVEVISSNTI